MDVSQSAEWGHEFLILIGWAERFVPLSKPARLRAQFPFVLPTEVSKPVQMDQVVHDFDLIFVEDVIELHGGRQTMDMAGAHLQRQEPDADRGDHESAD